MTKEDLNQNLHELLGNGSDEIDFNEVVRLVRSGADVNTERSYGDTSTSLWMISNQNQLDLMRELIELGADVNARDEAWITALMVASNSNALENVKLLVNSGADINQLDAYGNNCLNYATYTGSVEICAFLIANKADINNQNLEGESPLFDAMIKNRFDVIELLIESGANAELRDHENKTVLEAAEEREFGQEAAETIRALLADIERRASDTREEGVSNVFGLKQ